MKNKCLVLQTVLFHAIMFGKGDGFTQEWGSGFGFLNMDLPEMYSSMRKISWSSITLIGYFPVFTEALLKHGFSSDEEVYAVLRDTYLEKKEEIDHQQKARKLVNRISREVYGSAAAESMRVYG